MSTKTRGEKGESLVKKNLSKIKEHHRILNDITFVNEKSEMTHQIDHILIHPHGVFVIETKNYYGTIYSNTGEPFWIKEIKGERTRISNPLKQNKSHTTIVNRALEKKYDVIPVVVFVKNNAPYMGDENVINSVISMAEQVGMKTLSEGVETEEQAKFLREISCGKLQGYLFGKPVPYEDIMKRMLDGEFAISKKFE